MLFNWHQIAALMINNELRPGVDFDSDLDKLIERVHVAPSTPSWFYNVVKSVTRKFGLKKEVVKSDLDKDPPFSMFRAAPKKRLGF